MHALNLAAFTDHLTQGCTIVDIRKIQELQQGFIKNSLLIASGTKLKEPNPFFFDKKEPLLLVSNQEQERAWPELILQIGHKNIAGYLEGGFDTWRSANHPIDLIIDVETDELLMDLPFDENLIIMDVRPALSYAGGHLKDAINMPLTDITDPLRLSAIEEKDNLYIIGNNNEESFLAASILKRHDFHNLRVVMGGWQKLEQQQNAIIVKEPGMLN